MFIALFFLAVITFAVSAGIDGNARVSYDRLQALANGRPATPLSSPLFSDLEIAGVAQDQLDMYLAGVIDSGESNDWCVARSGLLSSEVNEMLMAALKQDYQHHKFASRDNCYWPES